MKPDLVSCGDELSQRKTAIRTLSLLWLGAVAFGEVIFILIWLFNPFFVLLPLTLVVLAGLIIGAVTYWLCRTGRVNTAGYFFAIGIALFGSVVAPLFGGFTGPLALIYVFAVLIASMTINMVLFAFGWWRDYPLLKRLVGGLNRWVRLNHIVKDYGIGLLPPRIRYQIELPKGGLG